MKPPQKNQVICGSNLEVTKPWPSNCIDAIGTDPPYGLEFMGKDWDKGLPGIRFWREFLRITKPGGFLLCFGGTRTFHRLACAIEDAGWEIRDCMMWLYGSGFPKSHNISKAIDKAKGAERKVIGDNPNCRPNCEGKQTRAMTAPITVQPLTAPATDLARLWDGYGTALKPAWEPIIVAMKPLDGTFAHNAEAHGVAGLNIDGGRIGTETIQGGRAGRSGPSSFNVSIGEKQQPHQGRWPANLILDEEAGKMLDEQTQNVGSTKPHKVKSNKEKYEGYGSITHKSGEVVNYNEPNAKGASRFFKTVEKSTIFPSGDILVTQGYSDSGGASRFFYCAKTFRKERNLGLEDRSGKKVNDGRQTPIDNPYQRGETIRSNTHPTVKPLALMKYLCTLLKMPSSDQIILDPFLGSGTTGMACRELGINFIGIEKEPEYCEIAVRRIAAVEGIHPVVLHTETIFAEVPEIIPCHDEHRQRIINAASAELRRNRK